MSICNRYIIIHTEFAELYLERAGKEKFLDQVRSIAFKELQAIGVNNFVINLVKPRYEAFHGR